MLRRQHNLRTVTNGITARPALHALAICSAQLDYQLVRDIAVQAQWWSQRLVFKVLCNEAMQVTSICCDFSNMS